MTDMPALLSGLAVGIGLTAIPGWLLWRQQRQLATQQSRRAAEEQQSSNQQITTLEQSLRSAVEDAARATAAQQQLEARLEERTRFHTQAEQRQQQELAQLQQQISQLGQERDSLRDELTSERTARESETHNHEEQLALLNSARENLTTQFRELAGRIFDEKSQSFRSTNREALEQLLGPLQTQIRQFETTVNDQTRQSSEKLGELKQQLSQVQTMGQKLQQEANNLATALKGEKKKQGNWGELILDKVLDQSGLRAGIDYVRERSFQTDEGRRRPDVIINLPDSKHLVIDAKVSLNDYTDFVNAEDDEAREQSLRAHRRAISDRINELSQKNYFDLDGIRSPEIVFMFVPVESAFAEAFRSEPDLFQSAINKNVLVTTPTTLLTSLNIVSQLWRFEEQNKNAIALADRAKKIAEKFKTFTDAMLRLGRQIDTVQNSYDGAMKTLSHGKGNLVKQVVEFRDLGVPVLENKTKLDEGLVDTALAELESSEPDSADPEDSANQ